MIKRNFPPGLHGMVKGGSSQYGIQLRAKQKAKRIYGLDENSFYRYYQEAERRKGISGDNLLVLLESRLDNVIYRAGLAESRDTARQLVNHGHFLVNGCRVTIPSYQVKLHDEIELRSHSQKLNYFKQILPYFKKTKPPAFLIVDHTKFKLKIASEITRDKIDSNIDTQAIIEFYSK